MRVLKFILDSAKPFRWPFFGMTIAMILAAGHANLDGYLIKLIIDAVSAEAYEDIIRIAIWYGAAHVMLCLVWCFYDISYLKTNGLRSRITQTFLDHIRNYDAAFFQNKFGGSLSSKIKDAATYIPNVICIFIDDYVQLVLVILIATILLAQIHWALAGGLLLFVIAFLSIFFIEIKKLRVLSTEAAELDSRIWGRIVDYLGNIFSVKYFASNRYERAALGRFQKDFDEKNRVKGVRLVRFYFVLGMIFSIYIIGCMAFLIHLYFAHAITPGDFAFVFSINYTIVDQLFFSTHSVSDVIAYWGAIDKAMVIFDNTPVVQDKVDAKPLLVPQGEIRFENVGFHYPSTSPLFSHLNLTIPAGQKVGLVGYSGGGKSTLVNLILRLYDVSEGRICIDGQDLRDVTQDSLHQAIGLIPQEPGMFHRSLMENIRYGRLDATDAEVMEAAKRAHAHAFITKLPEGYQAPVGERGVKISGGQRQRIAIARAILKDAPILILDEATSQLDSLTEREIQGSIWNLMQHKTTLIVAHRLSTLLHMDRILVFDKGQIVEDGTHEELLAQHGCYRNLWDTQISGFLLSDACDNDPVIEEPIA